MGTKNFKRNLTVMLLQVLMFIISTLIDAAVIAVFILIGWAIMDMPHLMLNVHYIQVYFMAVLIRTGLYMLIVLIKNDWKA